MELQTRIISVERCAVDGGRRRRRVSGLLRFKASSIYWRVSSFSAYTRMSTSRCLFFSTYHAFDIAAKYCIAECIATYIFFFGSFWVEYILNIVHYDAFPAGELRGINKAVLDEYTKKPWHTNTRKWCLSAALSLWATTLWVIKSCLLTYTRLCWSTLDV